MNNPLDIAGGDDNTPDPIEDTPHADWVAIDISSAPCLKIDATALYLQDIRQPELLQADEELTLTRRVKLGDFEARQKVIEAHLRLVVYIARGYQNRGVDFLDLTNEGNLGLIHALDKFDPDRGVRFATYAVWWVRNNIQRAIMNQSRTIRLPLPVIKQLSQYLRTIKQLRVQSEKEIAAKDIAEWLGVPVADVQKVLDLGQITASLDSPLTTDSGSGQTLGDSLPDERAVSADVSHLETEVKDHLKTWMKDLNQNQRQVIESRFGMNGREISTLDEIADDLNLSRERIRRIEENALYTLRRMIKQQHFSQVDLL